MRVAVCADLQFCQQHSYSHLTPAGASRLVDRIECFRWIIDAAVKRKCERLYVLGDIFDSRTSIDLPVLDAVCRAFRTGSERIPIRVTAGNHDVYLRDSRVTSLHALATNRITVIDKMRVMRLGSKRVACIPWVDDPAVFKKRLDRATRQGVDYVFGHAMIEGAVPQAKGLPLEWFTKGPWRIALFGDVHQPISLNEKPVPFVGYVGCPMHMHFGDADGVRGFMVIDTDTDELEFIENKTSPRFCVVDSLEDLDGVREVDFVRVDSADARVVKRARGIAHWVDAPPILEEGEAARIDARGMSDRQLLDAYIDQVGSEANREKLIAMGLNFLSATTK